MRHFAPESSIHFDLISHSEGEVVVVSVPACSRPGVDSPNPQIRPFVLPLGGISVIRLMAGPKQRLGKRGIRGVVTVV